MSTTPKITVIICTYNRGDLLSETLPSVFNQNVSESKYDVIVINNNSNDSTEEILINFSKSYSNLSVIKETQQGLSYARNAGYVNSTTEWIVYLDDDAMVPSDFVAIALQTIKSNKYDCFGGVYYAWYKYGKPVWFKDIYASTAEFYKQNNGHKLRYASGGIMAIKKSILIDFSGFPTHLGMKGNAMAYGEETFLQNQMKRNGYTIGINPKWNIKHIVNKYKLSPMWFIKNGYVTGRDAWIIYEEKISFKSIVKYMLNTIITLFKKLVITTPMLFQKNYYMQNWFIEIFHPISIQCGRVIGGLQLIFNKDKIVHK